ncbi:SWPV1-220 [Shearwaterpox virus]|uniref:SWPV1-220 n=1 Tax=Shearwaterpox virus TaxID=1974596 RepID=A0A1V0S839_CNPV|nr:SWPV1-220 [Shearwaterpox virus]
MVLINNIVTLDQLESSDYLYKLLVSVLPSLCFDYKPDQKLVKGYVHAFDVIHSPSLTSITSSTEIFDQLSKLGINYLLSRKNDLGLYFPISIRNNSGEILSTWNGNTGGYTNPIPCKISFNDLPTFTKILMKIRTTGCEGHARYFGGYIKHPSAPSIRSPNIENNLNFLNTYINSLTYPHTIKSDIVTSSYRPLLVNGVIERKDLINLLNVRALLSPASRNIFDDVYNIEFHANANNIIFVRNPVINTELSTMSLKYLVMFFQHFSNYVLGDLYFGGNLLYVGNAMLAGYVTSVYFKDTIKYIEDNNLFNLRYSDRFTFRLANSNRYLTLTNRDISTRILDMSVDAPYIITLLSMVTKSMKRTAIIPSEMSVFWDGIPYDEYKNLRFSDMMFLGSTCYLLALYDEAGITYCSMLTDVLRSGKTPIRVCILPRTVKGKTIPKLISEILESINNMSFREFPKYDTRDVKHIGLSDAGFILFFQFLRLVENKEPHISIKEILMAYVGIKIEDKGSPYLITPESYRTFIFMLFKAMGFNVRVNRTIVSSHSYTSYSISPRVTKKYLISMLQKASCSGKEAEKLLSSAHDLVSFMLAVNNSNNRDSYRRINRSFIGGGSKQNNSEEEEGPTLVQFISPVSILDRINVKGILSATSFNELLDTDVFLPENINFRNNLKQLLEEEDIIDGKSIAHIIPLNTLDRYIISGGASVSLVDILDNINERVPDENATNEVIDLITNALKESHVNDSTYLATNILNSIIPLSEKQMDDIKRVTCHGSLMFKQLARYIYIIEKQLKGKIADDVKMSILEKYKDFVDLSKSLYKDLISIDQIKSVLTIIRRTGREMDESPISQEDLQKAYNIAKPKILKLSSQYNDIIKKSFRDIRAWLDPEDAGDIVFDDE